MLCEEIKLIKLVKPLTAWAGPLGGVTGPGLGVETGAVVTKWDKIKINQHSKIIIITPTS